MLHLRHGLAHRRHTDPSYKQQLWRRQAGTLTNVRPVPVPRLPRAVPFCGPLAHDRRACGLATGWALSIPIKVLRRTAKGPTPLTVLQARSRYAILAVPLVLGDIAFADEQDVVRAREDSSFLETYITFLSPASNGRSV